MEGGREEGGDREGGRERSSTQPPVFAMASLQQLVLCGRKAECDCYLPTQAGCCSQDLGPIPGAWGFGQEEAFPRLK